VDEAFHTPPHRLVRRRGRRRRGQCRGGWWRRPGERGGRVLALGANV